MKSKATKTVFLSHNSQDKNQVEKLGRLLKDNHQIEPWIDSWNLLPGQPWQPAIEQALADCDAVAVCIGTSSMGPWQDREMRRAIARQVDDSELSFPVIPVLLPNSERGNPKTLPDFLTDNTWVEFRNGLDDEVSLARLASGIKQKKQDVYEDATAFSTPPYKGLEAFDINDSRIFFGRENLISWLIDAIRTQSPTSSNNRLIAVVGASGSGKSSLVKAGLLASIENSALPNSQNWPIISMRADGDPIKTLAMALDKQLKCNLSPSQFRELLIDLKHNSDALTLFAGRSRYNKSDERVIVFVDQFEEIFSVEDESTRKAFIQNLITAASDLAGNVVVVITMRSDFYGKCAPYTSLAKAINNHQFLIGPLNKRELKQAIEGPAHVTGVEVESGLTERIISEFQNESNNLPLLQFALNQTWLKEKGSKLTHSAYNSLMGMSGALNTYATNFYDELDEKEKGLCKSIILRLVQSGEGTEDTKRRLSIQIFERDESALRVITKLTDARLTTISDDNAETTATLEITHEALIRHWAQLRSWLDQDRESHRILSTLNKASDEWLENHKDPSYLFKGARLSSTEEWIKASEYELTLIESEFVATSRKVETDQEWDEIRKANMLGEEQRQRAEHEITTSKSLRRRAWWLTAVAAMAGMFALFAFDRTRLAESQKSAAVENESRAFTALSEIFYSKKQYLEAMILAHAAWPRHPQDSRPRSPTALNLMVNTITKRSQVLELKHNGSIYDATYLPEPHQILTYSEDNTARLWNATSGEVIAVMEHEDWVEGATYLPETQQILTYSQDNTARLWNATSGQTIAVMEHEGPVDGATYLLETQQILTYSRDNTARLWDATSGEAIAVMEHEGPVYGATYLPETQQILTYSHDNTARLWDTTSGEAIAAMEHEERVYGATYLPASHNILTFTSAGKVILWKYSWLKYSGDVFEIACQQWPHDTVKGFKDRFGISTDEICQ